MQQKQAIATDVINAVTHAAVGVRHNAGALATKAKSIVNHHVEDVKGRVVSTAVDRVMEHARPKIDQMMTPHAIGQIVDTPGVRNVIKDHVADAAASPLDLLFGKRKSAANAFEHALMGAGVGAAGGGLNAYAFSPEFSLDPRTEDSTKRDALYGAAAGAAIGAGGGYAWSKPAFHGAYRAKELAEKVGPQAENAAGALGRLLPAIIRKKTAASGIPFFGEPEPKQNYDVDTHAKIIRAKAQLSRAKLVHGPGFKKLEPHAQKAILKAHDNLHKTIEDAVLTGKYGGF